MRMKIVIIVYRIQNFMGLSFWSDFAPSRADLSLRWSHMS